MNDELMLIGASTGGVDALINVLSHFQGDCPPTLVVQHTGKGFSKSLSELLNQRVPPKVAEAQASSTLNRGEVLIAPGGPHHMVLDHRSTRRVYLREGPDYGGHCPSVDALFRSAVPHARRVTATLLTGMGRDGADAMRALREAGAATIAQDESSCVVYGMPRAAMEVGAANHQLHLDAIGPALLKLQSGSLVDHRKSNGRDSKPGALARVRAVLNAKGH